MKNKFNNIKIEIGDEELTSFVNKIDVYQDGTIPMDRDRNGNLYAISGHSHMGHIGMFKGTTVDDLKEVYPIKTNFLVGHKDEAFSNIKYPEGVLPRGSIWVFGLYIDKKTNRFFAFFHNETGWNGKGSSYDAYGECEKPHNDSDFRHIGLMHSDDEGRTWDFDRWVITSENVCFTEKYVPENINVLGQKEGVISLGSGDFSIYVNHKDGFIYLFYNIIKYDMDSGLLVACDTYLARTRIRDDGIMGDFVKYYNGSFSEAGNFGKESIIVPNSWHSKVVYSTYLNSYILTYTKVKTNVVITDGGIEDILEIRTSSDLINWSEPIELTLDNKRLGNHYNSFVSNTMSLPSEIDDEFYFLCCNNGTDVKKRKIKIK